MPIRKKLFSMNLEMFSDGESVHIRTNMRGNVR
jgi:hypothetical protein